MNYTNPFLEMSNSISIKLDSIMPTENVLKAIAGNTSIHNSEMYKIAYNKKL